MNTSNLGRIGMAAVAACLLAACSSATEPDGRSTALATPQTSLPPIVSPAQLDAGPYPTVPRPLAGHRR
jgi:hypothetical protein